MSLYFKDFARFLVCAVFSLNHQLLDGSSTGCTDSFLWCQCSVNTSSKKGNSSTCTSVKTCSQFCTPPCTSLQFEGPPEATEGFLPILSSQPDLAVPGRMPCILPRASTPTASLYCALPQRDVWGRRSGQTEFTGCSKVQCRLGCWVQTVLAFEQ